MRFPRLNGSFLQKGQAQNYTVKVECLFSPRRRAGHRETKFSEGRKVLEETCGVNLEVEDFIKVASKIQRKIKKIFQS